MACAIARARLTCSIADMAQSGRPFPNKQNLPGNRAQPASRQLCFQDALFPQGFYNGTHRVQH